MMYLKPYSLDCQKWVIEMPALEEFKNFFHFWLCYIASQDDDKFTEAVDEALIVLRFSSAGG